MSRVFNIVLVFLFSCVLLCFQSCKTYQNVPYFKDVPDSARISIKNAQYKDLLIQQGDILSVSVQTMDPDASAIFNQSATAAGTLTPNSITGTTVPQLQQTPIAGYVVDKNGDIEMPMLGKFKVQGLTTGLVKDTVEAKALAYYKQPAVTVRFANLKVSVLGEVLHPGVYGLSNEKNTILDALSLAGDLTIFAKRENLMLIRDSGGVTQMIRFSLNTKNLVSQDFYYLKQNDLIYAEPAKEKIATLDADKSRNFAIGASILSLIVIIVSRINF